MGRPAITPEMKIGVLLDEYPELEPVLVEMAPAFQKLRTPELRHAVAEVTTVRQVAEGGGRTIGEVIGKLREAAGCAEETSGTAWTSSNSEGRPSWANEGSLTDTLDARDQIDAGGHPLPTVMAALQGLGQGDVYALVAPFTPTPLIEKARAAGFEAWTDHVGPVEFKTYFRRA